MRPVVYCVIPADLAPELHDLLRRHFRDRPEVEVIVERRAQERRSEPDRRVAKGHQRDGRPAARSTGAGADRRRVRSVTGRRVADRRAALLRVPHPPLPRRARHHASRLSFVERLEPSGRHHEDLDTARLVMRAQAGDASVFNALYSRYFDRVYGYLRVLLKDRHEAEDATQDVFLRVLEHLPQYEHRGEPFAAWLFTVVRNIAITQLRKRSRRPDVSASPGRAGSDELAVDEDDAFALNWLSDKDLLVLVERLPRIQRQVLLLRYMLDLPPREIAKVLNRPPAQVRKLQYRALNFLRARLTALGRAPKGSERRTPWRARLTQVRVSRARRHALRV